MPASQPPAAARQQLALPLRLDDHAVFETFRAPPGDALVGYLESLADPASSTGCWIRGAAATGKTHLLQAVCGLLGDDSIYLPLRDLKDAGPSILEGLASRRCLCMDDLDALGGDACWEAALFTLVNEVWDRHGLLVVAARSAPADSGVRLPDLGSRLSRLPVFQLRPLPDAERIRVLQLRAGHRGLSLPDETAHYLLRRCRRDMASLYALLDRLDAASLEAQRRLTIPFVRQVLAKTQQ